MKNRLWVSLFFLILTLYSNAQFTYDYVFKPKSRKVDIPFELVNNLIVIKIIINKGDTLNFILDTGIRMNLITDPAIADGLGINYIKKINVMGFGENESVSAKISVNNEIEIATGVLAKRQNIVALTEDILSLSSYTGMPIHGVLGYDLFGSFVVKINFKAKIISLYDPSKFKFRKRFGEKTPISIEEGKPYMLATIKDSNQQNCIVKIIIDTGSGHGLLLEQNENTAQILPQKKIYKNLGKGISGFIYGHIGRIDNLLIANSTLKNIIVAVPDSSYNSSVIARKSKKDGNLGCEILKRYHVIFNYPQKYVAFKPIKTNFDKGFELDMSGLTVYAKGKNFDIFYIGEIEYNSPAHQAGLKKGDEIIKIDQVWDSQLDLNYIYNCLQKGDGETVKCIIKRNNQLLKKEIRLKRSI